MYTQQGTVQQSRKNNDRDLSECEWISSLPVIVDESRVEGVQVERYSQRTATQAHVIHAAKGIKNEFQLVQRFRRNCWQSVLILDLAETL